MPTIQTFVPNRTITISCPARPHLALDFIGPEKYGPIVHTKNDRNSLTQRWHIKNLGKEGGSGEFVLENAAVPGSYITASALAVDAPLYGSPNATIWIKQVNNDTGHGWFATSYKHYRFTYAPRDAELASAVLRPAKADAIGTTTAPLRAAPGEHHEDGLMLGPVDE